MSDGPYKSLTLSPKWKKVAKCAESDAYSADDIRDAVAPALAHDWRVGELGDTADAIGAVFDDRQSSLFDRFDQLERLGEAGAGNGFRQVLIQCAMQQANMGVTGEGAVEAAAAGALAIWASRHSRPIEEHYCREWDEGRASNVRGRIEDGIARASYTDIAKSLLGQAPRITPSPKQAGIDEGPTL